MRKIFKTIKINNTKNMTIINKSDTPSILSKNFHMKGDIKSSGVLEIEGQSKGTIKGNLVIIREDGLVEGKINSESVSIHGSFNGDIKAKNINIFKKAKIIGNIEYESLSVEDGAYIDGQFKRMASATTASASKVANENKSNIKAKAS